MAKKAQEDRVFIQNAVKTLATNIRFASVDNPVHSIVVTSSIPNEGKTTIATNLAQALASGGKAVLIVECDMRRRSLATALGTHARNGIYAVLSGQVELDDAVVRTSTRNVWFLDAEPHIPNPVDILGSKRFHSFIESLKDEYDYVVLDTPPLSAFIDAAVLGSIADGALLVVRRNFVRREEVLSSYEQLKKAEANVLGTVLNYCEDKKSEYYYYEYYSKDGKKLSKSGADADAPQLNTAPAQPAPRARKAPAAPKGQPATAPGLKPFPQGQPTASPDSTSQFLAQTGYSPRTYTEE